MFFIIPLSPPPTWFKSPKRGRRRRDRMVVDSQLPMQSVSIATGVVGSTPAQGVVYSIQHYVIKFVSDLRQVGGFLRVVHQ